MDSALLILPDFLIIILGALIARLPVFSESFWAATEKLVFYVLFPPLFFPSIATASLTPRPPQAFFPSPWEPCSLPSGLPWAFAGLCVTTM